LLVIYLTKKFRKKWYFVNKNKTYLQFGWVWNKLLTIPILCFPIDLMFPYKFLQFVSICCKSHPIVEVLIHIQQFSLVIFLFIVTINRNQQMCHFINQSLYWLNFLPSVSANFACVVRNSFSVLWSALWVLSRSSMVAWSCSKLIIIFVIQSFNHSIIEMTWTNQWCQPSVETNSSLDACKFAKHFKTIKNFNNLNIHFKT
jgi:hypothetical protein